MTAAPGQKVIGGRIPGERIETTERTTDSSDITTTETIIDSVAISAVSGRTYKITCDTNIQGSVATDRFYVRVREDDASGTLLRYHQRYLHTNSAAWPVHTEVEWTAPSTASKTFVATLQRGSGTGNGHFEADASNPCYLYVDYIRG